MNSFVFLIVRQTKDGKEVRVIILTADNAEQGLEKNGLSPSDLRLVTKEKEKNVIELLVTSIQMITILIMLVSGAVI